jgi:hypothetical protein
MGAYAPAVGAGEFLFVRGMLPMEDGGPAFVGRIGQELTIASGQRAAELAVGNALAVARDAVGLNRLAGVVRRGPCGVCP